MEQNKLFEHNVCSKDLNLGSAAGVVKFKTCDNTKAYPLSIFFDGECPICRREINLMKILDRKDRLRFIDFSKTSYHAREQGLNPCDLERVIHARWSDGRIITGVEVFREMWEGVGFTFLARMSRLPFMNGILVRAYSWFAKNRLRLTGRT